MLGYISFKTIDFELYISIDRLDIDIDIDDLEIEIEIEIELERYRYRDM